MTRMDFAVIGKLHGLLAVAIEDGKKMLGDDRYWPRSDQFHQPGEGKDGKCAACSAGAVIAMSLGASPHEERGSEMYSSRINRRLDAIDLLRQGYVMDAAGLLVGDGPLPNEVMACIQGEFGPTCITKIDYEEFDAPEYFSSFLDEMETLRERLESIDV